MCLSWLQKSTAIMICSGVRRKGLTTNTAMKLGASFGRMDERSSMGGQKTSRSIMHRNIGLRGYTPSLCGAKSV
jgi:hypothetical protein